MKNLFVCVALVATALVIGSTSTKAETTECTEITSIPTTITASGVYCLKGKLSTAITSGNAITINANNVTIDFNGWKLGGLPAGEGTQANGVYALNRKNIVLRNGSIRGFYRGVFIQGTPSSSSGHVVEDSLLDENRRTGIRIQGSNTMIINNRVLNTGLGTFGTTAIGIYVQSGNGIHIQDNTVSEVDETADVYGIIVDFANDVQVRDNRVFDLKSAPARYGISTFASKRVVLVGNSVTTITGGVIGLGDGSDSADVACVNNQVTGFSTNISGCDFESGNASF